MTGEATVHIQIVKGLVVTPGDTLVIGLDPRLNLTADDMTRIRERLDPLLPKGSNVLVVPTTEMAVVRAGEATN